MSEPDRKTSTVASTTVFELRGFVSRAPAIYGRESEEIQYRFGGNTSDVTFRHVLTLPVASPPLARLSEAAPKGLHMKNETQPQVMVSALRRSFRGHGPCHCQDDAKLSENELLLELVRRKVLLPRDIMPERRIRLDEMREFGEVPWGLYHQISHRVTYLDELNNWSYADLIALDGIGRTIADKVERVLATWGVTLSDGDPGLVAQSTVSDPDPVSRPPTVDASPEEIRRQCADGLLGLATDISSHTASITRMAIRVATGAKCSGILRRYANSGLSHGDKVIRIAQPLLDMEDAGRAKPKKAKKSPPRRRRPAVEDVQIADLTEDNVIRNAFQSAGGAS